MKIINQSYKVLNEQGNDFIQLDFLGACAIKQIKPFSKPKAKRRSTVDRIKGFFPYTGQTTNQYVKTWLAQNNLML